MGIRSAAKAIIISDGNILLNKCNSEPYREYYALPGGGQNQYETLHDAVIRECLEETGYTIKPVRLAAVCEEISMSATDRENLPDYAHKMYHIFICETDGEKQKAPTETDSMQTGTEWVDISSLPGIRLLPKAVKDNIEGILSDTAPVFLGTEYIDINHG